MTSNSGSCVPVLLMVSGGSDSEALLEMAVAGELGESYAAAQWHVLHVNHMLRGDDADADEAFVVRKCAGLGVGCTVERVDIAALAASSKSGMEAVAREKRYELAERLLDKLCADAGVALGRGRICTAHTLDDRIETFFMRTLVGTGPGGLGSIPRVRGRVSRPLLDMGREQLRDWLRAKHPGQPDTELWREDATNDDGSNFRSRVRHELLPVLRGLRPNFEAPLAKTMDLISEEEASLQAQAESVVYRNLTWDGKYAELPLSALSRMPRPFARRVLKATLLVVEPTARLESVQIERVLDNLQHVGYVTETSGGIRVRVEREKLTCENLSRGQVL